MSRERREPALSTPATRRPGIGRGPKHPRTAGSHAMSARPQRPRQCRGSVATASRAGSRRCRDRVAPASMGVGPISDSGARPDGVPPWEGSIPATAALPGRHTLKSAQRAESVQLVGSLLATVNSPMAMRSGNISRRGLLPVGVPNATGLLSRTSPRSSSSSTGPSGSASLSISHCVLGRSRSVRSALTSRRTSSAP